MTYLIPHIAVLNQSNVIVRMGPRLPGSDGANPTDDVTHLTPGCP